VEPAGSERAQRIYEVSKQGIDLIAELAAERSIDAGFSGQGSLEVFTTARTAEAAHERVEMSARAGIPVRWVPRSSLAFRGATGRFSIRRRAA